VSGAFARHGSGPRARARGADHRELPRAGCNQFTAAKLEGGFQEPAWPLVLALAKALGVTCEAFNGKAAPTQAEARPRGRPRKAEPTAGPKRRPRRRMER
jgi:hypothetical protein